MVKYKKAKVYIMIFCNLFWVAAYANPTGGVVSGGNATISTPNSTTLQVNQTTDKAIIDWQTFNIQQGETTRFVQPSASSISLNRVNAMNGASSIFGNLQANGQVWLINPAGIVFGPTAQVNVGGLLATTSNITNEDFLAGRYRFSPDSRFTNGSVINHGTITVQEGGLAGLVGNGVKNTGVIQARLGTVLLGGAQAYTLDFDGDQLINFVIQKGPSGTAVDENNKPMDAAVTNTGVASVRAGLVTTANARSIVERSINMAGLKEANHVSMRGGRIILAAGNGNVKVSGKLYAPRGKISVRGQSVAVNNAKISTSGRNSGGLISIIGDKALTIDGSVITANSKNKGGSISLLGQGNIAITNTTIAANGELGGGQVLVGGNWQGKGPEVNAINTYVDPNTSISADALTNGNGGKIVVWGNDTTSAYGHLSAKGGLLGGNGGAIETSGQYLNVNGIQVSTYAPQGITGIWLLDPTDITIDATLAATLSSQLASSNVIQIATNNITVNSPTKLSWSAATSLTLTAGNSISINSEIEMLNSGALLILNAAGSVSQSSSGFITGTGGLTQSGSGTVTLSLGNSYFGPTTVNSGTLTLSGLGTIPNSSAINIYDNAILNLDNSSAGSNSNRIGDTAPITMKAGTLNFINSSASGPMSETIGQLNLNSGESAINVTVSPSYSSQLIFSGISRSAGGTILFNSTGRLGATAPAAGVANINFTAPPDTSTPTSLGAVGLNTSLYNKRVIPYAFAYTATASDGYGAVTYNTSLVDNTANSWGVRPLRAEEMRPILSAEWADNVYFNSPVTLPASIYDWSVNSIQFWNDNTLDLNNRRLNVFSGAVTGTVGTTTLTNGTIAFVSSGGSVIEGFFHVKSGVNMNLNTDITGNGGVTFSSSAVTTGSASTYTLGFTPTYSGSTNINSAVVQYGLSKTLPTGSPIVLSPNLGSTLNLNGSASIYSLSGGGPLGGGVNLGSGTLTVSNATGQSYGGIISGTGGITLTGNQTLTGSSTYTGPTTISSGTLSYSTIASVNGGNSALGAPTTGANGTINIGATGVLKFIGSADQFSDRIINLTGSGATLDASGTNGAVLNLTGGVTGNANDLVITGSGIGLEYGAIATTTGKLDKNGTGSWGFFGTNTNTYTGMTSINSGFIQINTAANLGNYSSVNFNGGKLTLYHTEPTWAPSQPVTYGPNALSITPFLIGSISKTYDGTTAATLSAGNYSTSGATGADIVTLTSTSATYDNKDVVTDGNVFASGLSISVSSYVDYIVHGYKLSSPIASGFIGTISPANLSVSGLTANNKVYDSTTVAGLSGTAAVSPLLTDVVNLDGTGVGAFADKNVANGKAVTVTGYSISGADSGNYVLTQPAGLTANITPYQLTVSATGVNRVYDATAAATVTLGSNPFGDALTQSYTSASFADKNVANGKTVSVTGIGITGADAGNYTLQNTTASTTANITPFALTIAAAGVNRIYDATTNATVNLSDNRFTNDVFSDSYTGASFADKNVANGKAVSVTGINIAGTDAGNYTFNNTAATTANITPYQLTVSATGVNRVYDATAAATVTLGSNPFGDALTQSYTSASFADKNVANGKTVSVTGIGITGADAGNYTLQNTTASTTANITPFALTIAAAGVNRIYDATTNATVNLSDNRFTNDVFSDSYTGASFADKNVANGKAVSVTGINIAGTDAGNYTFNNTAATTANITPYQLTVSATGVNRVYDATAAATVTLGSNPFGDALTQSYTSASFADKNVANGKTVSVTGIGITGADAGNYTLQNTTASTTANITPFALTIAAAGVNRIYDATTNATVNLSDNRFTNDVFSDSYTGASFADKNVANGKAVSVTGINIAGTDAGNYTFNNTAATTANITPYQLTVSATGVNRVYDATAAATVTLGSNPFGDALTQSYTSASFADKNVANGKTVSVTGIGITGADAGNYTLQNTTASTTANITPFALTIAAAGVNRIYDATTNATVNLSDNRFTNDVFSDSYTGASFADKNVANGKAVSVTGINIAGTDAGNYTFNNTAATTANITPYQLTVSATGVNRVYDATAAATVTLGSNPFGDALTQSYASASFADKNVANGKTVSVTGIGITGADAGNYTLQNTTASTTANITPFALTIAAAGVNRIYDATTNATVNLSDNRFTNDVFSDSYTGASFADKNVANGKAVSVTGINIAGTDAGNYTFNNTAATTANITPYQLTVSATGVNRVYDATAAATVTLGSNPFGDALTQSYTSASFADKNVANGKTVSVTGIGITGADAGNYTLQNTTASTTANITPFALTIAAAGVNRIYDATTNATVNLSDNRFTNDVFSDSYTGASFADKNVANGKAVSVTGINIAGTDAGNYTFNNTAATTANITPYQLTVSATGVNRVYDATAAATVTLGSNPFGDALTQSYTSASFADKNVANGKTVSVTGIGITGADAGNYTLQNTTASTTANITPFALTIAAAGVNRIYDATTNATVNLSDNRFTNDVFSDSYTGASFADKNVANGKAVSVTGINIAGTDAGNYTFNNTAATTANITPYQLTVSATGVNRVYDATAAATVTLGSNPFGDALTQSYTSASFADKNVANGKTVSVTGIGITGADAGNYTLQNTTASTTANITPFALTIAAAGVNRIYDATTNATVNLSDNRFTNDVFSDSYTGASFADKNVANGKAVSVTGINIAGTDAGNYTFNNTAATTANITPYQLTVSATGVNRVYDATAAATVTLGSNPFGDALTQSYTSASFADKNVANGKTVSVTGIGITGADAGNYTLQNTTASTTANITPFALTIAAAGVNRIYDATTNATVNLSDNRFTNDVFSDSYTGASFADKNVANGKAVSVTGINIAGTDAGNYTFNNTAATTADITPAILTSLGIAANNKIFDANTSATLNLTSVILNGVLFTDSVGISSSGYAANFTSPAVGTNIPVTVTNLGLTGSAAGNYTLTQPTYVTGGILAAPVPPTPIPAPPANTVIAIANSGLFPAAAFGQLVGPNLVFYSNTQPIGTNASPTTLEVDNQSTGKTLDVTSLDNNLFFTYGSAQSLNNNLSVNNSSDLGRISGDFGVGSSNLLFPLVNGAGGNQITIDSGIDVVGNFGSLDSVFLGDGVHLVIDYKNINKSIFATDSVNTDPVSIDRHSTVDDWGIKLNGIPGLLPKSFGFILSRSH